VPMARFIGLPPLVLSPVALTIYPQNPPKAGRSAKGGFGGDFDCVFAVRDDLIHRDEIAFARRLIEQPIEGELYIRHETTHPAYR
jgi:hypothetical protein